MKKVYYYALTFLFLTSCAGQDGKDGAPGQSATNPIIVQPSDPVGLDIATLVQEENEYRLGLGQTALTPGLSCTLYSVTGGDRIQASIAGHNTLTGVTKVASFLLNDVINQPASPVSDGMNVLPEALRSVYKNLYLLRCQGQVVLTQTGYYLFELNSDDGSVLYVDGAKLIDNDNNHGPVLSSGQKYLRRGVHTIRLDYAQTGGGSQALQLGVNGALLPPTHMFH